MFTHIETFINFEADILDRYLEAGWYRSGKNIFTCNFLMFKEVYYSAIWYRIQLNQSEALLQKVNTKLKPIQRFKTVIEPFEYNIELENLYQKYIATRPFDGARSLKELLDHEKAEYNTLAVKIFDFSRLIGVGIMDTGQKAVAGIICFFDPDYQKFSLGKMLMYSKIKWAMQQDKDYFYPGYFAPGYSSFDYKLDLLPANGEFLDIKTNTWQPMDFDTKTKVWPFELIKIKLEEALKHNEVLRNNFKLLHYYFYYANMTHTFNDKELYDYPIFLLYDHPLYGYKALQFNIITHQYELIILSLEYIPSIVPQLKNVYNEGILKQIEVLQTFETLAEIDAFFVDFKD